MSIYIRCKAKQRKRILGGGKSEDLYTSMLLEIAILYWRYIGERESLVSLVSIIRNPRIVETW